MNNEIILQSLKESFEILKDSWETRNEAIVNCIVETEAIDGDMAMDMWNYILEKIQNSNADSIIPENEIEPYIYKVITCWMN